MNFKITPFFLFFIILAVLSLSIIMGNVSLNTNVLWIEEFGNWGSIVSKTTPTSNTPAATANTPASTPNTPAATANTPASTPNTPASTPATSAPTSATTAPTTPSPVPNTPAFTGTLCDTLEKPPYSINDKKCDAACQNKNLTWNNSGCPRSSLASEVSDECNSLPIPPYALYQSECDNACQNANIAWNNCGYTPIQSTSIKSK